MEKIYNDALEALKVQGYEQTVAGHLERIEDSKNVIVGKLNEFVGLELDSQIDDAALALANIESHGDKEFRLENAVDTLPAGYYRSITITLGDVSEEYTLQEKSVTPTKEVQTITSDTGIYGLSKVTVAAIPAKYQDVTPVTLEAKDAVEGSVFVDATGAVIEGTLPVAPTSAKVLDATTDAEGNYINNELSLDRGVYEGQIASIVLENRELVFDAAGQTVTPAAGKVLGKVVVPAAPKSAGLLVDDKDLESNGVITVTAYQGYLPTDESESITLGIAEVTENKNIVHISAGYMPKEETVVIDAAEPQVKSL